MEPAAIYTGLIQYDLRNGATVHSTGDQRSKLQDLQLFSRGIRLILFSADWKQLCQRTHCCPVLLFLELSSVITMKRSVASITWTDSTAKSAAVSWGLSDKQANFPARTEGYTLCCKKLSSSTRNRRGGWEKPKHYHRKQHFSSHNTPGKV